MDESCLFVTYQRSSSRGRNMPEWPATNKRNYVRVYESQPTDSRRTTVASYAFNTFHPIGDKFRSLDARFLNRRKNIVVDCGRSHDGRLRERFCPADRKPERALFKDDAAYYLGIGSRFAHTSVVIPDGNNYDF